MLYVKLCSQFYLFVYLSVCRKWISGDVSSNSSVPLPTELLKGATDGKRSANSKRISVLNKLFMRHITELMATGNNASQFLGRGIEINRVIIKMVNKIKSHLKNVCYC